MTKKKTPHDPWAELLKAVGGRAGLARILRVAESTVYRWTHKLVEVPHATQVAVDAVCREHKVAPIFGAAAKEVGDASTHR